jgi:hypothetical protein
MIPTNIMKKSNLKYKDYQDEYKIELDTHTNDKRIYPIADFYLQMGQIVCLIYPTIYAFGQILK